MVVILFIQILISQDTPKNNSSLFIILWRVLKILKIAFSVMKCDTIAPRKDDGVLCKEWLSGKDEDQSKRKTTEH
jgi:hypothetical protein